MQSKAGVAPRTPNHVVMRSWDYEEYLLMTFAGREFGA